MSKGVGKIVWRIVGSLAGLLLTAFSLVILVLVFPSVVTTPAEETLSSLLGRRLTIDGPIQITLAEKSQVRISNIAIENPDWSRYPDLVSIDVLSITFDSNKLLFGALMMGIDITGVDIGLEARESGGTTWEFAEAVASDADEEAPDNEAGGAGIPLLVDSVTLSDLTLNFADTSLSRPLVVEVQLIEEINAGDDYFDFLMSASVNEIPLQASGSVGTFDALLSGKGVEFNFSAELQKLDFKGSGYIPELQRLPELDSQWELVIFDMDDLLSSLGYLPFTEGDARIKVDTIHQDGSHRIITKGLIGQFQIDSEAHLSDFEEFRQIKLTLNASGASMGFLADLTGLPCLPIDHFELDLKLTKLNERVDLPVLKFSSDAMSMTLNGKIDDFKDPDTGSYKLGFQIPEVSGWQCMFGVFGFPDIPIDLVVEYSPNEKLDNRVTGRMSVPGMEMIFKADSMDYLDSEGAIAEVSVKGDFMKMWQGPAAGLNRPMPLDIHSDFVFREDSIELISLRGLVNDVDLLLTGQLEMSPFTANARLDLHGDLLTNVANILRVPIPSMGSIKKDQAWSMSADLAMNDKVIQITGLKLDLKDLGATAEIIVRQPFADRSTLATGTLLAADISKLPGLNLTLPAKNLKLDFEVAEASETVEEAGSATSVITFKAVNFTLGESDGHIELAPIRLDDYSTDFLIELTSRDLVDWSALVPNYTFPTATHQVLLKGSLARDELKLTKGIVRTGDDGEFFLSATGIYEPTRLEGSLLIEGHGNRLSSLGQGGSVEPPDQPFTVKTRFTQDESGIQLSPYEITVGESALQGFLIVVPGDPPTLTFQGTGEELDLSMLDLFAEDEESADDSGRLIPDWPLLNKPLGLMNADIDIKVDRLKIRNVTLYNLDAELDLQDSYFRIDKFSAASDLGTVTINGEIAPQAGAAGVEVSGKIDVENLVPVFWLTENDDPDLVPTLSGTAHVNGRGMSTHELLSTLNGHMRLSGSAGKVNSSGLDRFGGDILNQVASALNPLKEKSSTTDFLCSALVLDMVDGIVRLDPGLVVQTEKMNLFSRGKVDLNDESVDLQFSTRASKGLGLSAASIANNYLKIGGTLSNPRLAFAPKEALVASSAAVATGGLSALGVSVWNRMFANKNPCQKALDLDPKN
ncbi:MAG: AsmA family protein [bacterium]|nr:AsmA family protein [Gammaproteobacteria bacterium]HIL97270.1 AsmA family protein [Pseudomonadales bacterium]